MSIKMDNSRQSSIPTRFQNVKVSGSQTFAEFVGSVQKFFPLFPPEHLKTLGEHPLVKTLLHKLNETQDQLKMAREIKPEVRVRTTTIRDNGHSGVLAKIRSELNAIDKMYCWDCETYFKSLCQKRGPFGNLINATIHCPFCGSNAIEVDAIHVGYDFCRPTPQEIEKRIKSIKDYLSGDCWLVA